MRRIYIAGPLTPKGEREDTEHPAVEYIMNCRDMVEAANHLMSKGWAVYCPALDFLNFFLAGNNHDLIDHIFKADLAWVEVSDAVFMVGRWWTSSGAKKEMNRAMERGIPIYDDLEKVPVETETMP